MEILEIVEETALELIDVMSEENYIVGTSEKSKKLFIILREKGVRVQGFIDHNQGALHIYGSEYPVITYDESRRVFIANAFEVFDVHTPTLALDGVDTLYRIAPFVVEHALGIQTGVYAIEHLDSMIAPSASVYADVTSKIVLQNSVIYPRVKIQVYGNSTVMIRGVVLKEDVTILAEDNSTIVIMEGTTIDRGGEIHAVDHSKIEVRQNAIIEKHITFEALYDSKVVVDEGSWIMKYVFLHSKYKSNISIGKHNILNYYDYLISYDAEILVGNDCLFATNINAVVGFHSLWSLDDEEWGKKMQQKRKILVANHVWLGMGVILLPGADIGEGSMIGAGSIVNKKIPENVCCVGDRCVVIKDNIRWEP